MDRSPINHIFVDFENVHVIDLNVPIEKPVSLVLLIGEKQKRIDTDLVEQLLKRAAHVQLVRLGASGKNALDFALAYHVGRAVATDPTGFFHVVSADKGFDPLIAHLKQHETRISRHDSFAALLPLLTKSGAALAPASPTISPAPDNSKDHLNEFIDNLRRNASNRPKKEKTLRSHLKAHFGAKLTDAGLNSQFDTLRSRIGLTISANGAVLYPSF